MIVNNLEPVTLIGGGDISERDMLRATKIGKQVIAADGGANAAFLTGFRPSLVIGDMDSLSEKSKQSLKQDQLKIIKDQDSTDFDKCLRSIDAPLILGVGFTGARIDHQLGNFNSLMRFPETRCILLGTHEIAFLAPPKLSLDLEPGSPVSLFPFGAVGGSSEGLEWPIQGLDFKPDGQIGTLNRANGPISLSFNTPKMLVILPEQYFESVSERLLNTPEVWT